MDITWLTQGGFMFSDDGWRLVVDPYLSNVAEKSHGMTRIAQFPISLEDLKPDCVFCTHDHVDHLDPIGISQMAREYPDCDFLGPVSVAEHYKRLGIESNRIHELAAGMSMQAGSMQITATQAYHSDYYATGLIVRSGGKCVYLSGDTLWFGTLCDHIKKLAGYDLDVAILCINGRLGNMTSQEALKVVEVLKPRLAIPMHYGLFAENTVDPLPFIEGCQGIGITSQELTPGIPVTVNT